MTTVKRVPATRAKRFGVIAATALAAGLLAFPTPAAADGGGHGRGHGNGHGHARGYSNGPAHGYAAYPTVPRTIIVGHRGAYQPYYNGRVYYAPHHHYHATYRFPVFVGGVVAYRPYSYCNDALFLGSAVTLPHLAFGFNYASPGGVSFGGVYASPGYVAPAPYPYVVYPAPPPYPYPRRPHCHEGGDYEGDYDGD